MINTPLILCVDDEPINISIMQELLQDSYELLLADSGRQCLDQVQRQKPDLILLDVNMPEMDGLEACRKLKDSPEFADIPIIFVSALASEPEFMAGYRAGGDDYVTKPFSIEVLKMKIEVVLSSQRRKHELEEISDGAVKALKDNLTSSGEMGMIIRFIDESYALGSFDEMAEKIFDCVANFGLDGSLLILSQPENQFWFSDDIDRPLERRILESLNTQDRLVSFGSRLAINTSRATILIRNMPVDEERLDQLRHFLSMLVEGLDARLKSLEAEQALSKRQADLSSLLQSTQDNFVEIDCDYQSQQQKCSEILESINLALQRSVRQLKADEIDSNRLLKQIENAQIQIASLYEENLAVNERLKATLANVLMLVEGNPGET
jgi:CheY-like chemotaxis protein